MATNAVQIHGLIEEAREMAQQLNVSLDEAMLAIQSARQTELLTQLQNLVQVTVRGTWPPSDWSAARKAGLFPASINGNGGVDLSELVDENAEQDKSNPDDWLIFPVQVVTAGTAVQGPDIDVDFGVDVIVRQRRHSATRTGYVAPTEPGLSNALTRVELGNNDSFQLPVDNLKRFWFDSDTNTTFFELVMERRKQN